ncbi:hypothetical protein SCUP234_05067 [Seiridium cupressi]
MPREHPLWEPLGWHGFSFFSSQNKALHDLSVGFSYMEVTAIIGDRLFFGGGIYAFDDGQALHPDSELFWLSLNETVDVSGPVDISNDVFPVLPTEGTDQSGAATRFSYNHTMLYSFARTETSDVSKELWAFNTVSDTWMKVTFTGNAIMFGNDSYGIHTSDPISGTAFFTGGRTMACNGTHNGTAKFENLDHDQR